MLYKLYYILSNVCTTDQRTQWVVKPRLDRLARTAGWHQIP